MKHAARVATRSIDRLVVAFLLAGIAALVHAQAPAWPDHPVRIVIPYPPGGGTDTLARLVGQKLGEALKQPVVLENRAGGNAVIGMDAVRKAAPDGYTLMAIAAGPLDDSNLAAFTPIALFAAPSYMLVVHPSVKATSVRELVALAKAQPGKIAYGSTGAGAASHLASELFKAMTDTDMLHVPYKGVGAAVTDLIGGHVLVMIAPPQAVMQHVKSGTLRALAVTGSKRMPTAPELPTIAEAGVPGYEAAGWFGLVAPAGVPAPVITRVNAEVNRILQTAEIRERLLELGAEPARTTPAEFLAFIRADNAKWAKLIKEKGIVVEGATK